MRFARSTSLLFLAVCLTIGINQDQGLGEIVTPGNYQGTYHIDRWGQHRFGPFFVSPELAATLKAYLGLAVELSADGIEQPTNPGGAMVTKVSKIRKLPSPIELAIVWAEPIPAGETLLSIAGSKECSVKITIINRSKADLVLDGREFLLQVDFARPSGAGMSDPMHFWSGHQSLTPRSPDLQTRHLSIRREPIVISPEFANLSLKGGESSSWTTPRRKFPVNEFELCVTSRHVESNKLRLDMLADQPMRWQNLEVDLLHVPGRQTNKSALLLEAVFKNLGTSPILFALTKVGDKFDLSQDLVCYDRDGLQIAVARPEGSPKPVRVELEPGKTLAIPIEAPAGTRLARLALFHRTAFADVKLGITPLDIGYLFSPHLQLR